MGSGGFILLSVATFISGQTVNFTMHIVERKRQQQRKPAELCDDSYSLPANAIHMERTTPMVVEGLTFFHGNNAGGVEGVW